MNNPPKLIRTSPFPDLPDEFVENKVSFKDGTIPNSYSLSYIDIAGTGFYDWTNQIDTRGLGRVKISSNNFASYLKQETPTNHNEYILVSGYKPQVSTSTRGLLKGKTGTGKPPREDDFKLEAFPDYNEPHPNPPSPEVTEIRGKFQTQADYDDKSQPAFPNNDTYDAVFKYSVDGETQPLEQKVNSTYFGYDGAVNVMTNANIDQFDIPGYVNPEVNNDSSQGGGIDFDPDPNGSDRGSPPQDDFTPPTVPSVPTEDEDDDDGSDDQDEDENDEGTIT